MIRSDSSIGEICMDLAARSRSAMDYISSAISFCSGKAACLVTGRSSRHVYDPYECGLRVLLGDPEMRWETEGVL